MNPDISLILDDPYARLLGCHSAWRLLASNWTSRVEIVLAPTVRSAISKISPLIMPKPVFSNIGL